MSYTPGPWVCFKNGEGKLLISDSEVDAFPIAEVYGVQDEQNARLIAAAPDLLEALKRLAAYGDVFAYRFNETNPYEQAIAAIEKAEGK